MNLLITVQGLVQGVGFRPFTVRLANELNITGIVQNAGGDVRILAAGSDASLQLFLYKLSKNAPASAQITRIRTEYTPGDMPFPDFRILKSSEKRIDTPIMSPDLPLCDACRRELFDEENRRYQYPFISCVDCGPRYSILTGVPYDRETTSMDEFAMCDACAAEYKGVDRRMHAQTISCPDCGPQPIFISHEDIKEKQQAIDACISSIQSGEVVAMKGIGGYHLVCLPSRSDTVMHLRQIKARDQKPLAVMFPDLSSISHVCNVSQIEEQLLTSSARPIVLLPKERDVFVPEVCASSRFVGAFLPYSGLHELILSRTGPLVVTSANRSEEPILFRDEEALSFAKEHAIPILYHTREIVTPMDDSVVREISDREQMVRRGRGYVPLPIQTDREVRVPILSLGGDLKNSFNLSAKNLHFLSQYAGDLQNKSIYTSFSENISHMRAIFSVDPIAYVCDCHPGYFSSEMAKELATREGKPLLRIQHHHAHIASVMAEHGVCSCIGVAFDGVGYGDDGAVWGGEFLLCQGEAYLRKGHLSYVSLVGGDAASKMADRTADCYLHAAGAVEKMRHRDKEMLCRALETHTQTSLYSSMGRLFDAVASVLCLCSENTYEGECAISLENAAAKAREAHLPPEEFSFLIQRDGEMLLPCAEKMVLAISDRAVSGGNIYAIADGFHVAVTKMIVSICKEISEKTGEKNIALSGGVFANTLLVSDCIMELEKEHFAVYLNEQVPPGDGGICLGQAYVAGYLLEQEQ